MAYNVISRMRRRFVSALIVVALAAGWHIAHDPGAFWEEFQMGFNDAFDPDLGER